MATYNGWTIVTMPSTPAPKLADFTINNIVASNASPFTGQQQIIDWQAQFMEASLTLPALAPADAAAWITFLKSCKGPVCVFLLANTTLAGMIPSGLVPGTYWRLKASVTKWSVSEAQLYGIQFDVREAI